MAMIRTRVHTIQEGWDLCCAIMAKGYEGVQNDSARYNDTALWYSFTQKGYCWVGVWGHCLYILNTHDKNGRRALKDIGKSKFINILGLDIQKRELPRSLRKKKKYM